MADPSAASSEVSCVYHVEHSAGGRATVLARDILLLEPWVVLLRERGEGGEVIVRNARTNEVVIRVPLVSGAKTGQAV